MNKKRLANILIGLGILLICIPLFGTLFNHYQQDKMYAQYQESLEQEFSALDETFGEVVSAAGIDLPKPEPEPITGVLGRIKIPAISSNLLLVEGTGAKQLNWGAGHVTGTAMPGETGNTGIAAHRDYTFGTYFSRLDELNPGNEIIVEYQGISYVYLVTESFIVEPDQVFVLARTEDPTITLITCHPRNSGKQRLIVKGKLVE